MGLNRQGNLVNKGQQKRNKWVKVSTSSERATRKMCARCISNNVDNEHGGNENNEFPITL